MDSFQLSNFFFLFLLPKLLIVTLEKLGSLSRSRFQYLSQIPLSKQQQTLLNSQPSFHSVGGIKSYFTCNLTEFSWLCFFFSNFGSQTTTITETNRRFIFFFLNIFWVFFLIIYFLIKCCVNSK